MSTAISGEGNYIKIAISGVARLTIPKLKTVIRLDGSELRIDHDGEYATSMQFSDVTSPVAANIEALRVAIRNILNS